MGVDGGARLPPTFARFAWGLLAYTLFVILFGAWVRISGSGAGCGDHWPTCHGALVPSAPELKTITEYTHRLTSGLLGPLTIALVVWAWRGAGWGAYKLDAVRTRTVGIAASAVLFFIIVESLIGAGLVLKELVADDDSVARAVIVALHLGNTLLLTGAGALTAWYGAGRPWLGLGSSSARRTAGLLGLLALALVSMSGAVTALGDTLFPVPPATDTGLLAHLREDLSPGAHFLVRLRVLHPVMAVCTAAYMLWLSRLLARGHGAGSVRTLARWVETLVWIEVLAGAVNIALGAPGSMQLLHLLLAQGLWISMVLLFFVACGQKVTQPAMPSAVP